VINCVIEVHLFSYTCWYFCTWIWSRSLSTWIYVNVWRDIFN